MFASEFYHIIIFLDLGSAYGTAKSGIGISSVGICKPEVIMKSLVPVVMAGILGIYGLIMSVIIIQKSMLLEIVYKHIVGDGVNYNYQKAFSHMSAGLCCGLSSLVRFLFDIILRLLGMLLESLEMQVYGLMRDRAKCLSE